MFVRNKKDGIRFDNKPSKTSLIFTHPNSVTYEFKYFVAPISLLGDILSTCLNNQPSKFQLIGMLDRFFTKCLSRNPGASADYDPLATNSKTPSEKLTLIVGHVIEQLRLRCAHVGKNEIDI